MASTSVPPPVSSQRSRRRLVAWALYDWANSAHAALIQTFVFATYFATAVAENSTLGTAQWGNAIGLAGLLVALIGPVLGAMADQGGPRQALLRLLTLIAVVSTALMWFVRPEPSDVLLALVLAGVGTLAFELGMVLYNALLPELAPSTKIGRWSGWGWGFGYLGGLSCLVIALVAFVGSDPWLPLPTEQGQNVRATFLLTAGWFLLFSLPLLSLRLERRGRQQPLGAATRAGLRQLVGTLKRARESAPLFRFLVARMLFIDGLATLFAFGGVYAAGTFGLDTEQVLVFGILLNVTAAVGAVGFAWLDDHIGPKSTLVLALLGLILLGSAVLVVESTLAFWVLGGALGIFVGPAQAAGRSYLAHAAPPELRTELFGLFAFSGKVTAFVGPLLVGWVTWLTESQRLGMTTIVVLFVLGLLLLLTVPEVRRRAAA